MGIFSSKRTHDPNPALPAEQSTPDCRAERVRVREERDRQAAKRKKRDERIEANMRDIVGRMERDPAVNDRIREVVEIALVRAGCWDETAPWPPSAEKIDVPLNMIEDYKAEQKKRYARQQYESQVLSLGRRMLLCEGWQPWAHGLIVSKVIRHRIQYVFSVFYLKKSAMLSMLPKDVLYQIFTYLSQEKEEETDNSSWGPYGTLF